MTSINQQGSFSFSTIRHLALRYGAFLGGLGPILTVSQAFPLVGSIPAITMLPLLPVTLVGVLYWLFSGRYRESIAVWIILITFVFGLLFSSQPVSALGSLIAILTMIGFGSLVICERDWLVASRWFLSGLVIGVAVLAYFQVIPSIYVLPANNRLGFLKFPTGGTILDPNFVGFHAGFGILVASSLLSGRNLSLASKGDRRLAIFAGIVAAFAVLLTQSLGATVSTIGAVAVMILFGSALYKWQTWVAAFSGFFIGVILIVYAEFGITERVTGRSVGSAGERTMIWYGAFDVVTRDIPRLLFGYGLGDGPAALGRYAPWVYTQMSQGSPPEVVSGGASFRIGVHSTYVSFLLDFGLVGLTLACIAVLLGVARVLRIDRGKTMAIGIGMIAFFLLISVTQTAYALAFGISAGCGGMALGYLYHHRTDEVQANSLPLCCPNEMDKLWQRM